MVSLFQKIFKIKNVLQFHPGIKPKLFKKS